MILVPSIPMNVERLSTAGSSRIILARACCLSAIAGKEIHWGASEMPRIMPVSWTGKKPLGTMIYRKTVNTRVAAATSRVAVCLSSTQRSVFP